ncbi:MAG TPA: cohesin domain-containing protein, partial [bacterium]
LTEDQEFAADVTEDRNVSGSDAQAILRYLAFYSENTGSTGDWRFAPDISVFIVQKDSTANFKAYLLGDVSGDWSANSNSSFNPKNKNLSFKLKLNNILVGSEQIIKVPVRIENLTQSLHTAALTLEYDPKILTYQSNEKADSCSSFMMAANGNEIGKIHIAMAGVKGICCDNDLFQIIFQINNDGAACRDSELRITRAFINDFIVDQIQNAKIYFKNTINSVDSGRLFRINNYPNPFNLTTTISFHLTDAADITLVIFNIQGQHIKTLLAEKLTAGEHQINWTATSVVGDPLPSGIYFCRMEIITTSTANRKLLRYSKKMFLLE